MIKLFLSLAVLAAPLEPASNLTPARNLDAAKSLISALRSGDLRAVQQLSVENAMYIKSIDGVSKTEALPLMRLSAELSTYCPFRASELSFDPTVIIATSYCKNQKFTHASLQIHFEGAKVRDVLYDLSGVVYAPPALPKHSVN